MRPNRPAEDRWYSRDIAAIAKARGLRNVAPFFIDADATPNTGGYPVGGMTVVVAAACARYCVMYVQLNVSVDSSSNR